MTASPEQQMARIAVFARLKDAVEDGVERHRDMSRGELSSGQFAAQIFLAIDKAGFAMVLDGAGVAFVDKAAPR
jgi:hypothetical protein